MVRKNITILLYSIALLLWPSVLRAQQDADGLAMPFYRNIPAKEYHGHNRNFDVECDREGRVYVANFEGLLVYDKIHWKMYHTPGVSRITSLYRDADGVIWFGGYNTLGRVHTGTYTDSLRLEYVACDTMQTVNFGEVERLYPRAKGIGFCTTGGQTYRVENQRVLADKLPYDEVRPRNWQWEDDDIQDSVHVEHGFAYLGSSATGLILVNEHNQRLYDLREEDGLCSRSVKALAYDGQGTVWGATENGLFYASTSHIYTEYGVNENLTGQVNTILKINGQLFVGTLQGLFVLDDGHFLRIPAVKHACWQLIPCQTGGLLAATADGIFALDEQLQVRQITHRHSLSLLLLPDGSLLSGELDGIYRLPSLQQSGSRVAQIANVCRMVLNTRSVKVLNLQGESYDMAPDGSFVRITTKGLSLLLDYTDDQGRHWTTNSEGLGLVGSHLSERAQQWMRPLQGYDISTLYAQDGVMWLGGNFGLLRFNLTEGERTEPQLPRLYIRHFQLKDESVTISYTLDKIDPLGTQYYSYRLHADDPWSAWTTAKEHEFIRQNHGEYQLQVRAMDALGNIIEHEPIHFEIPRPFYLKWYAWLFYLLLLSLVFHLFYRARMRRLLSRQHELEAMVEERTRELHEAQHKLIRQEHESTVGKLTHGLIDRILNPLNYINNFSQLTLGLSKDLSDDLQDMLECESNQSADFRELTDDCEDLLGMMSVNLRKIHEHGTYTSRILKSMEELLKERTGNRRQSELCTLLNRSFQVEQTQHRDMIQRYGIECQCQVPQTPLPLMCVEDQLVRVVQSLLANSIYAVCRKADQKGYAEGEHPRVTLSLQDSAKEVILTLWDNGTGIEERIQEKVFDPFFTTKSAAEAPGIGLYMSKQIIQDHNGAIQLRSVKGQFTEFTIHLPKS